MASHGGTVARNLIRAVNNNELNVEVGPLVTNNRQSLIFEWCRSNGVEVHHISSRTHPIEGSQDLAICGVLREAQTDFIVLSGYMKKIGPETLKRFHNRILNVHPALLPKYGGKGMFGDHVHESVLASQVVSEGTQGAKQTNITSRCGLILNANSSLTAQKQPSLTNVIEATIDSKIELTYY